MLAAGKMEESRGIRGGRILSLQFTITFYADSTQEGKAGRWKRRRERTNERPSKACKFGNGPFPRSVGRSLGRGEILQKDPQGGMKLRTNLAMHKVRTLPCPCTRLLRLGRFDCFEGTWTYIALMMKNGVILRQFALQQSCDNLPLERSA